MHILERGKEYVQNSKIVFLDHDWSKGVAASTQLSKINVFPNSGCEQGLHSHPERWMSLARYSFSPQIKEQYSNLP
jgi:hypothetical protein